ncbi:MAG: zinc-finger domain-containing protein [Gammaproteobacteria bacterium]
MNNAVGTGQAINVSLDQKTVCCRGASNALGHPAVYLTFAEQSTVQCYYCGCEYTQALTESEHPQPAG